MDILIYLMILGVVFVILTINQLTQHNKKFQESNKLEQLWRYRFYLLIPFQFIVALYRNKNYSKENMRMIWDLLIGDAQINMKWTYTMDEVEDKIKRHRNE